VSATAAAELEAGERFLVLTDEADADAKIMTQKWGWRHRRVTYRRVALVGGDD
jgi:hypothetical protein